MTGNDDWTGWADAWREPGAAGALDLDAIEQRVRRERDGQRVRAVLDLAACAFGATISLWAILSGRPSGVVLGLAGVAFSLFALAVTLGRKRTPGALAARTVAEALRWEIATARAAARTSIGGIIVAAAALVFLALCTAVFHLEGLLAREGAAGWLLFAALVFALGSGAQSWWLLRRRRARVLRLERLLADLTDEQD